MLPAERRHRFASYSGGVWRRTGRNGSIRHRRTIGDRRYAGGSFCRDARVAYGAVPSGRTRGNGGRGQRRAGHDDRRVDLDAARAAGARPVVAIPDQTAPAQPLNDGARIATSPFRLTVGIS